MPGKQRLGNASLRQASHHALLNTCALLSPLELSLPCPQGGTAKLADVGLARLQTGTYLSDVPLIGKRTALAGGSYRKDLRLAQRSDALLRSPMGLTSLPYCVPNALQCSAWPLTGQPACRCCTGTFAWIAPEVLMGGKQCSSAVDIYRWGGRGQGACTLHLAGILLAAAAQHGGEWWVAGSLCRPSARVSMMCHQACL